ncbi:DUF6965 family protein [Chryseobacterium sp.]|uniref:DUF6965 family protein n=1 Tax=Chryseobacterium sp. TaxID=1871047 RepID=UPI00289EA2B2|nr:DUF6371 domain-containing protein [Chryseobacterium sp.]
METQHQYILDKSSKKYHCPQCNKKTFVLYIDTLTNEYLPEQYGRCDRESKCNYFLNPYNDDYFKEQNKNDRSWESLKTQKQRESNREATNKTVFFDFETFKKTLSNYEQNIFVQNLIQNVAFPFEADEITKVIELYRLGTVANGYRAGAITFPFIDIENNVRAIQVKQFDETNHTTGTDFLHSIIEKHHNRNNTPLPKWLQAYTKQDKRVSCLFGEHLLNKYPSNPIALVEAPKTAIYGSLYFGLPNTTKDFIWLAVYNKSSFSFNKLNVLQNRNVFVFPDLSKDGNTFKEWESKAKDFEKQITGCRFVFSDLLERFADEQDRDNGNDIADILIKQDWRLFRKVNEVSEPQPEPKKLETVAIVKKIEIKENTIQRQSTIRTKKNEPKKYAEIWNKEITELEQFYSKNLLPTEPIKLNNGSNILDVSKFIQTNLQTIKANNGKHSFLPYLNRLQQLKQILTEKY